MYLILQPGNSQPKFALKILYQITCSMYAAFINCLPAKQRQVNKYKRSRN